MIHIYKHVDIECPFLEHLGVGAKIFDKANALIFCLLKVIFNIHVSGIKLHETGVDKFKFVINYGRAWIQLNIH